ncbi:MAG: hypothetical protein IH874_08835 [Candidatus Dadabacteria bacterium]|nr:hypothetical protein [Candidatus Dadabacteria bacterium]
MTTPSSTLSPVVGLMASDDIYEVLKLANNNPSGALYIIYQPKEITHRRKEEGIDIDSTTKGIKSKSGTASEGITVGAAPSTSSTAT